LSQHHLMESTRHRPYPVCFVTTPPDGVNPTQAISCVPCHNTT